jgi:flagellar biosynthesis/type III secretory pathway protein FliH
MNEHAYNSYMNAIEQQTEDYDNGYEEGFSDGHFHAKEQVMDVLDNVLDERIPTSPIHRILQQLKETIDREVDVE